MVLISKFNVQYKKVLNLGKLHVVCSIKTEIWEIDLRTGASGTERSLV